MIAIVLAVLVQEAVEKTAHYEVRTDAGAELARKVGADLEACWKAYGKLLPYAEKPKGPFVVRVFSTRAGRDDVGRALNEKPREAYYYNHDERVVLGYVLPEGVMQARLRHECFHQYFRAIINEPPQWVNEGLAEYVEHGSLEADGFGPGPPISWVREWREGIRGLDDGPLRGKYRMIPVRELMGAAKQDWLRQSKAAYPESWGLARFLLSGGDAKLRSRFAKYLSALKPKESREENTRAALEAAFGDADFEAIEKAFVATMDGLEVAGHALFLDADKLLDEEKHEEAVAKLTEAIAKEPRYDRYYYFRGISWYSMSKFEEAEKDLLRAIELGPEYSSAHFVLGKTYVYMKKYEAARASLDRALELDKRLQKDVEEWRAKIDGR